MEIENTTTVGFADPHSPNPWASIGLPTYGDLLAFFHQVEAPQLSDTQAIKNRVSALSQFLQFLGRTNENAVGQELGEDFPIHLAAYLAAGKTDGRADGTLMNQKSLLRHWEETWRNFHTANIAPRFDSLIDAVTYYSQAVQAYDPELTDKALSLKAGLNYGYISDLRKKKARMSSGSGKSAAGLAKLEVLTGAPPTTFTSFINKHQLNNAATKSKVTEAGKRTSELLAQEYALKTFSPRLTAEIKAWIKYKTAVSAAPLKRVSSWRMQPKAKYSGTTWMFDVISLDGKRFAASAESAVLRISSFFGALAALGHDPEKFSLAYLTDHSLLLQYVEFMEARLGKITLTITSLIALSNSLMFAEKGYLTQCPEMGARLPTPVPAKKFVAWCAQQRELNTELLQAFKEGRRVKKGRDVDEPILAILERQHPITALMELIDNMERYLVKQEPLMRLPDRLAFERDLLIIKILVEQPLRVKMIRDMTYTPNNLGNLHQKTTGIWAIRFRAEDFKNEKGAAQEPYDVPLSPALAKAVEHYLAKIRPLFSDDRTNVFVSSKNSRRPLDRNTTGLSNTIRTRVHQFLPCCPSGFGPHAFRHIIATDYIKNNPEGFQVAASVLHDKIETVIKHYSHVKKADTHKYYAVYLEKVRRDWKANS